MAKLKLKTTKITLNNIILTAVKYWTVQTNLVQRKQN